MRTTPSSRWPETRSAIGIGLSLICGFSMFLTDSLMSVAMICSLFTFFPSTPMCAASQILPSGPFLASTYCAATGGRRRRRSCEVSDAFPRARARGAGHRRLAHADVRPRSPRDPRGRRGLRAAPQSVSRGRARAAAAKDHAVRRAPASRTSRQPHSAPSGRLRKSGETVRLARQSLLGRGAELDVFPPKETPQRKKKKNNY
eukprot:4906814-Prymnesium_polylepis.1